MLVPAVDRQVQRTDNQAPSELERATEAYAELAAYLRENPVIQNEKEEKLAADWKVRTSRTLEETRAERDGKIKPHSEAVAAIRTDYAIVQDKSKTNAGGPLQRAYDVLKKRITDRAERVEAARAAEAERLRLEAEEKERIAREAEAKEQDAIACADVGELTDVGAAIEEADQAFGDYARANRAAAVAERNVPLRIHSSMGGRAVTMRTTTTLSVESEEDACKAINAMGLTPDVAEAICTAARKYHKAHNEYPPGITITKSRSL